MREPGHAETRMDKGMGRKKKADSFFPIDLLMGIAVLHMPCSVVPKSMTWFLRFVHQGVVEGLPIAL